MECVICLKQRPICQRLATFCKNHCLGTWVALLLLRAEFVTLTLAECGEMVYAQITYVYYVGYWVAGSCFCILHTLPMMEQADR
jgi:hypothetical protein